VNDHYHNPSNAAKAIAKPALTIFSFKFNKISLTFTWLISYTAELIAWITDPTDGPALARGRRKDIKFSKFSLSLQRPQSRTHFWSGRSMTARQLMHGVYSVYGLGLKALPALVLPDPI
jgi:hypothetical protein